MKTDMNKKQKIQELFNKNHGSAERYLAGQRYLGGRAASSISAVPLNLKLIDGALDNNYEVRIEE